MTGFRNIREWAECEEQGRSLVCHFRKAPSLAGTAGWWHDLSMASGSPPANFFASTPLTSASLTYWDGLYHGDAVAPAEKYLATMEITTTAALTVGHYRLYDYVLYYPFIDMDTVDTQTLINSVPISRYTDGVGLEVLMIAQAPTVGAGNFTFTYVNENDVEKTSPVQYCTQFAGAMGQIVTAQPSPAVAGGSASLKLAGTDKGIKRILSVTMGATHGGLASMVIAKPLCDIAIYEARVPNEINFVERKQCPPKIEDGAFLALLARPTGSIAGAFYAGKLKFIWTN